MSTSGGVGIAPLDSVAPVGVFLNMVAATSHQINIVATDPMVPDIHFLLTMVDS